MTYNGHVPGGVEWDDFMPHNEDIPDSEDFVAKEDGDSVTTTTDAEGNPISTPDNK